MTAFRSPRQWPRVSLAVVCAAMLVACESVAPTPPATSTAFAPRPIATPTPTATPSPTPTAAATSTATPTPTPRPSPTPIPVVTPSQPTVAIGAAARFAVDLAITETQKAQGLSGRPSMARDAGMLFLYQREGQYSYWMREMRFPLDFVWIGGECTVAEITADVPPPSAPSAPLPLYTPSRAVLHVLEINGGEAARRGLSAGDRVRFLSDSLAGWRC